MAQGLGGVVVPAYAAFAAQVFAIGAAFRFLTSAGDLATLEKGQIAYASSTGIALKTLTTRIQEATDSQIAFQDAAQAAAIGTAAGLSADQLERLGKAAKDASIILGRDVTDSFNTLIVAPRLSLSVICLPYDNLAARPWNLNILPVKLS